MDDQDCTDDRKVSNAVVCSLTGPRPPDILVKAAEARLRGKGGYPCMDCGPNLYLIHDAVQGWSCRVAHDATCPSLRGIVPKKH